MGYVLIHLLINKYKLTNDNYRLLFNNRFLYVLYDVYVVWLCRQLLFLINLIMKYKNASLSLNGS